MMMANWQRHAFRRSLRICQDCAQVVLRHCAKMTERSSAGIIIIGNEILKAQVKDTNSYFMCDLLYKCGVTVDKISVIRDDVEDIENEIRSFSEKYTYVITSGGIGPTHDDVTYEGLAKAFGDSLHYHPTLVKVVRDQFGYKDASSASYKMAYIPSKAELKFGKNMDTGQRLLYPCINLENVYVFPGSPIFLEKSFQSLHKKLFSTSNTFVKDELYINTTEESFAKALTKVAAEFPHVTFGSYPVSNCSYYRAFVTIESNSEEETKKAKLRFCDLVPPHIFVQYDPVPHVDCVRKFQTFLQNLPHREPYDATLEALRDIYRYPEKVAIYFDGSVESTVLLHLAHIINAEKQLFDEIAVVHSRDDGTLANEKTFYQDIFSRYRVNARLMNGAPDGIVKNLRLLKPKLQILLLGERGENLKKERCYSLDNDGSSCNFKVKRPLIGWTNDNLWKFVKSLCLPYQ